MVAAYWFGFFYSTFYLFDTFSNVPYEALGPELSDDYHERNNVFFVAKIFNYMGKRQGAGGKVQSLKCPEFNAHFQS